jgi:DNA-binding MarR family transcriptional regulator
MAKSTADSAVAETQCNCLAIRRAARQVTQLYDRHLAPAGLRVTQYSILAWLERLGPLSIGELATAIVIDRTTLARAIQPLERDGLLVVGPGSDGRTRRISLTSRGRTGLVAASPHWQRAQEEFETALGAGASRNLRAAMRHVVAVIQQ